jgi:hypothetical protein
MAERLILLGNSIGLLRTLTVLKTKGMRTMPPP